MATVIFPCRIPIITLIEISVDPFHGRNGIFNFVYFYVRSTEGTLCSK